MGVEESVSEAGSPAGPERVIDDAPPELSEQLEGLLLGGPSRYTRRDLAQRAGMSMETAAGLWHALGFAHVGDDEAVFGEADLQALRQTTGLIESGVLDESSRDALVRTWGRSFARLAEWQTDLLASVALGADDPASRMAELASDVIPAVGSLQDYIWRRHLLNASERLLSQPAGDATVQSVGFVDIVGYTSRSKHLDQGELLALVEHFEATASGVITDHGGRLIKTIGDEVLFVADDAAAATRVARDLVERSGHDEDFPEVRAGVAHGPVASRLGDVFGPTVNIASRLTSLARPGTVLLDAGAHEALEERDPEGEEFKHRRLPRTSVKGYHHLEAWAVRRPR